jgi:hypothetical protein
VVFRSHFDLHLRGASEIGITYRQAQSISSGLAEYRGGDRSVRIRKRYCAGPLTLVQRLVKVLPAVKLSSLTAPLRFACAGKVIV